VIGSSWATLLETRRRDGSWVGTPVNMVAKGDRAYFATPSTAAKVKRLRNFSEIRVAPSTLRGRPTGTAVAGRARLLEGEEATAAAGELMRRHPVVHRWIVPFELRLKRARNIYYEVRPLP
jgi:PPOX class probable F420-dependent enzyme